MWKKRSQNVTLDRDYINETLARVIRAIEDVPVKGSANRDILRDVVSTLHGLMSKGEGERGRK
jgi:hypothetical protein